MAASSTIRGTVAKSAKIVYLLPALQCVMDFSKVFTLRLCLRQPACNREPPFDDDHEEQERTLLGSESKCALNPFVHSVAPPAVSLASSGPKSKRPGCAADAASIMRHATAGSWSIQCAKAH